MTTPLFSVIMPAHQAAPSLSAVLGALTGSDFPRERWELIVVDDASTDSTSATAGQWADRVVSLRAPAHGPAFARNCGAEAASGEWLLFIDADVAVHSDTLRKFATALLANPHVDAIFGAYDDDPPAPGFVSQYRNLVHRYTHLRSAGEAATFWAGCGAVRRSAFDAVGGFDADKYRRPQIEDIELGYRLRDRGSRLVLLPEIQATHLKEWTFREAILCDVWDRGVPWVRLLLERGELSHAATLNLRTGERFKTLLVALALTFALGSLILRHIALLIPGVLLLLGFLLSNAVQFAWLRRRRGQWFALLSMPMSILYYAIGGLCIPLALGLSLVERRPTREAPT